MSESRGNLPSPKGILKKQRDKNQKSFQWDEMNILATYHPADKTYGHMKIDEPKTPFARDDVVADTGAGVCAEDLAARLAAAAYGSEEDQLPRATKELVDPVEEEHKRQFKEKRKAHYNEFLVTKMAKERLSLEDEDDVDVGDDTDLDRAVSEAARNARYNAAISRITAPKDEKGHR